MRGNDVSKRTAEPVKVLCATLCNLQKLPSIKLWLKSPLKLVLTQVTQKGKKKRLRATGVNPV